MSSKYVRDQFNNFIDTNSSENIIDLTGQFLTLNEVVSNAGLGRNDDWVGIQFIGASEEIHSITATNSQGRYREIGSVYLHIVARVSDSTTDDIINRSETLRNLLRGRRIEDMIIEGVAPENFEAGTTLELDAGYQSASIILNYYRDLNL